MKTLIAIAIITIILCSGCSSSGTPVGYYAPVVTEDSDQEYRENRMKDQIMNHGYGGCTPNFSTGGCL